MSSWERHRINPVEWMRKRGWPVDHLTYDPKLRKGDYSIIRGSSHDGTLLFTEELIERALVHLAMKASFHKPRQAEFEAAKEVQYTIGPLRLVTVFGTVDIPAGRYPGQRERVRIPVRMTCSS